MELRTKGIKTMPVINEKKWYNYREVKAGKIGVLTSQLVSFIKNDNDWNSFKPKDFEYRFKFTDGRIEVSEVRNVTLLNEVFRK
tara:strand:+ start:548 stop:799 length:252 start_codon:yes stop_codon:yes gene_type:complete